jgi:transcriptional regulator GlxA family with amidase domain
MRSRPPTVVALVFEPIASFELGVACEVFGLDRSDMGVPRFRFLVCSEKTGIAQTKDHGVDVVIRHGLEALRAADIVIIPGWAPVDRPVPTAVVDGLRRAHARGAQLVSFCSGSFVLAATGLLDGRRAATHWMFADRLQAEHPAIEVDANVLYVDDESGVATSAGTAAAIDLCLHLVRRRHGANVAGVIARRMVAPPQRDGGQTQYIEARTVEADPRPIRMAMDHALGHLADDLTVEALAAVANQSPRTFARHFRAATGTTPLQWLLRQRIVEARRLLETTDLAIERVAEAVGFGTAAALRLHFARLVGTSPTSYRRSFAVDVAAAAG